MLFRFHQKRNIVLFCLAFLAIGLLLYAGVSKHGDIALTLKSGKNIIDNLAFYPDKKPTLCSPVEDADIGPVQPGVKYGRPLREARHVMYTSVPKCGSRSLVWIMWELIGHYNSSGIRDFDYRLDDAPTQKEKAFFENLMEEADRPTFFHGHQRYLEFDGNEGPVFISILRDPVTRFVSWYYFMRHGDADMNDTRLLQDMLGRNSALTNETIDDCFKKGRSECKESFYFSLNVMIFCGYEKRCTTDKKYALAQAKKNLDKYLVVGIMEEYEDTVRVLEKLMPSVFGGGAIMYKKINEELASNSKTKFKREPSPEILEEMRGRMKEDIEFYEYAKGRFHNLKERLRIGMTRRC